MRQVPSKRTEPDAEKLSKLIDQFELLAIYNTWIR